MPISRGNLSFFNRFPRLIDTFWSFCRINVFLYNQQLPQIATAFDKQKVLNQLICVNYTVFCKYSTLNYTFFEEKAYLCISINKKMTLL